MYFDRFDICEAYSVIEPPFNVGGIMWERPSNKRRNMSTDYQLGRMQFKPRPSLDGYWQRLTPNGREIYRALVDRYGFRTEHAEMVVDTCRELDGAA